MNPGKTEIPDIEEQEHESAEGKLQKELMISKNN